MLTYRCRNRIVKEDLEAKIGKVLGPDDFDILITGSARIEKPDGSLLAVVIRSAFSRETTDLHYPLLHTLQQTTDNRGIASGAPRVSIRKSTYARPVKSMIIGATDPMARHPVCRLTAWTARHLQEWQTLIPLWQQAAGLFAEHVPDRFAVQNNYAQETEPEWIVPGTPYTTVTVNNTYPTGVHQDAGDLHEGFSNMFVVRRGHYTGGELVLPQFRVAVDLHDGDMILFDAHEWHGNCRLYGQNGLEIEQGPGPAGEERISCVLYYRTKMRECGKTEDEFEKAKARGKL